MEVLNKLVDKIKASPNSEAVIGEIVDIIKHFIKESKSQNPNDAINWLKKIGGSIRQECPSAFPILNILNRAIALLKNPSSNDGVDLPARNDHKLFRMMSDIRNPRETKDESSTQAFSFLLSELSSYSSINEEIISTALESVCPGETILAYCQSRLMSEFIVTAVNQKRVNAVVVVSDLGRNEPIPVSDKSITYISELAVFSVISQVKKVFLDCYAIMADANVLNTAGTFTAAVMAREFSIPVIVLSPMYRITPFFSFNQFDFNDFISPHTHFRRAYSIDNLEVVVPKYDVISAEFVSLVITQAGEFCGTDINQAFADYYNETDQVYQF